MNRHFSKEDIQMANSYIKSNNNNSISYHQRNANQNHDEKSPIRMASIKRQEITSVRM